jgi:glycosyltransferase involved in cell wall biosynthesis
MKLCYAVFHYNSDEASCDPVVHLAQEPLHVHLPRALAARGHQVDVLHLFPRNECFEKDGVRYHFITAGSPARALSRVFGSVTGRRPVPYELAHAALRRIHSLDPDLIHFHGLTLNLNLFLLCKTTTSPILLHSHGGFPAIHPLARTIQRFNFRRAARLLFTTRDHALPFVEAGILNDLDRVVELIETSSTFSPRSRRQARQRTRMEGDPVVLWTGRLHPIKDPLTALRGFAIFLRERPQAQLYLYYKTAELLPVLQEFVRQGDALAARVHFRGRALREEMEDIYNSADLFLQASQREFSGCAVLEAMACGVVPVVTDIPSFRAMTENGRYGALFPRQDPVALARALADLSRRDLQPLSREVREKFHRDLSFEAMAKKLEEVYREVRLA